MLGTAEDLPSPASARAPGGPRPRIDVGRGLTVCPFLQASDGAWSSVSASRELHCWAVRPPVPVALPKQRQSCLVAGHAVCATYVTAMAPGAGTSRAEPAGTSLWPAASPVPVVLDVVRARPGAAITLPRFAGQALLVGLMVVAFVVLVISRTTPLGGTAASGTQAPSLGPGTSAVIAVPSIATASPAPSLEATPSPAPSASAAASPSPTASPSASQRTYKVRAGDTIAAIAGRFHTTVKAIVSANNIVDPRTIHPGQVLIIP